MTCLGRASPAVGLFAVAILAGCCLSGLAPVDPECAGAALQSALEAWTRGESADSLAHLKPCIHVSDADWSGGRVKLLRFEVATPPTLVGAGLRFQATLTIQDARGRSRRQAACYRVYTAPHVCITRETE